MNLLADIRHTATATSTADDADSLDLREVMRFFNRRRLWLLIGGGLAAAIVLLVQAIQPAQYDASARMLINPPRERSTPDSATQSDSEVIDSGTIESQIEILMSRPTVGRIVERLKLESDPYWAPRLDERLRAYGGAAKADASLRRRVMVGLVGAGLEARRVGLTYVIALRATTESPTESARIANAWVDAYLDTQMDARVGAAQRTNTWLSDRLESLKTDVKVKENAVESYRRSHGLLTAEGVSLTEQQVRDLQTSVIQARAELAEKRARYQQLQELVATGSSVDGIASVINSDTIRALRAQEAENGRREAEAEAKYGAKHPELAKIAGEHDRIEQQIGQEIDRISVNLKNEVDVGQARLDTLQSNVSGVQGQLNLDNASAVKLRELERDAAATRTLYESFLSRFKELSEVESFKIVDARLVSGAERPSAPSGPRLTIALALALGAGLIVGLVLALTAELLDDSIHDGNVITGKFGRTLMATLPFLGGGEMRRMPPNQRSPSSYVVERPMSPFAESIRALRSSILYSSAEPGKCKTLAICSALPEEGKTTVALSLARLAAMAGERVLVIDCDQRRGSLSALCGGTSVGLHAVLNGDADYASVLKTDTESDCDLLLSDMTGRATPQKPFQSETVGTLLAKARSTYDLILLDCPPVLLVTEARAVARACDGVVMVARWGKTSARTLSLAIDRIEAAGGDVLGVAINCAMPVGSSRVNSALMLAATQKNTMPE